MMIKLLLSMLMVLSSADVAQSLEPPESVMSDSWDSFSLGIEEGYLGAFCELEKRGVLSREQLIRLNKKIYEDSAEKVALECRPPNCVIDEFTREELEYLNNVAAEDGCPWLKHPETR